MVFKLLKGSYQKVKQALGKTSRLLASPLSSILGQKIDEHAVEELEQLFYEADLGVETASELAQLVETSVESNPSLTGDEVEQIIQSHLLKALEGRERSIAEGDPTVILVVGVNGSGKTTACAKLAKALKSDGKKVLLGACDTFRAAAIDQLEMWADRTQTDVVKAKPGSDPSSVAFDSITAGRSREKDVIILDTAGRLQAKTHLMHELEKMVRSCHKSFEGAPHETLLVVDATCGHNAIDQARVFHSFTPLTGLILTKLDGTAKGGIAFAIEKELDIPIKFIGTGEGEEDLQPFDPNAFVQALWDR